MSRQILIEIPDEIDDDRLAAISEELAFSMINNWGHHPTVRAMILKQAIALYPRQWELIDSAFDSADSWTDDCLERGEEHGDYSDEDMERMEQDRRDRHELLNELKVARGLAFNFDEHWTPVAKDDGDVQFLSVPEGDERTIWTVLDCDGELSIAPGEFLVNRLYFIQTTEPWTDADTEKEWIY